MSEQTEKIRVLIADDVTETREILEKALYFEKDMVVVGKAANGREAVAMARQLQPHVVLMDINMPEMDGIAATEAILTHVPGTQVIILSVQHEQEYLRRAMLAGAREYLIKPPDSDELVRSIRHVSTLQVTPQRAVAGGAAEPARADRGKLIAVFSPKGGVGCTAIAANLAIALRQVTQKRVALVDGNVSFGDVGVAMNMQANKNILDLTARVDDMDAQLIADVLVSHSSQVSVLLAPPDSQSGEGITPDQLRGVLDGLREAYDYIVVDTATSYDDRTLSILDAAERIVVIMTLELTAIKNVKQFLELARPLGYADDKLMLVLNQADPRLGIRLDDVENQLHRKVALQIGNAGHDMAISLNQGVPLVLDRRTHPVTRNFMVLAAMIAQGLLPEAERIAANAQALTGSAPAAKAGVAPVAAGTAPAKPKGLFSRILPKR
jgi:pilus assembly protein CpaE